MPGTEDQDAGTIPTGEMPEFSEVAASSAAAAPPSEPLSPGPADPTAPVSPAAPIPGEESAIPSWLNEISQPQAQTPPAVAPPPAPAEPMAQPEPVAQGQEEVQQVREMLQGLNYDVSRFGEDVSDNDVMAHVVDRANIAEQYELQYEANRPYLQLGQQYAQHADAFRTFLAQQQGAPQPAAQPAPPSQVELPSLPELLPEEMFLLGQIRTGKTEAKEVPLPTLARLEAYANAEDQRNRLIAKDPVGTLAPGLQERFDSRYPTREQVQQMFQDERNELYNRSVAASQDPHWYVHGPDGRPIRDPQTGQPKLSPYGVQYAQAHQMVSNYDPRNPAHVTQLIQMLVGSPPGIQPAGNGQPPVAVAPIVPAAPAPAPVTPQKSFVEHAQQFGPQPVPGTRAGDVTAPGTAFNEGGYPEFGQMLEAAGLNTPPW